MEQTLWVPRRLCVRMIFLIILTVCLSYRGFVDAARDGNLGVVQRLVS